MRDRPAIGALALGTLDIDVDPLPVAAALGEVIDGGFDRPPANPDTPSSRPVNSAIFATVTSANSTPLRLISPLLPIARSSKRRVTRFAGKHSPRAN